MINAVCDSALLKCLASRVLEHLDNFKFWWITICRFLFVQTLKQIMQSFQKALSRQLVTLSQYTDEKLKAYAVDCEFISISHFGFRFLERIQTSPLLVTIMSVGKGLSNLLSYVYQILFRF